MLADQQFKVMVTSEDRVMIRAVAEHFRRTQSDTVRLVFRELYEVIQAKATEQPAPTKEQTNPA
jgi:hypothetical protein